MNNLDEIKDFLIDTGAEDAVVLDSPDYANAFLGVTTDGQACYSYSKMIEHLLDGDDTATYDEAAEFIECNVIRALPYMNKNRKAPIIIYDNF